MPEEGPGEEEEGGRRKEERGWVCISCIDFEVPVKIFSGNSGM